MEPKVPTPPAIDLDELVITTGEAELPDLRFDFTFPAHCVQQIVDRLEEEKQPLEGRPLRDLLAQICFEEAVGRFEIAPLWRPMILPHPEPMELKSGEDFCFSALLDNCPEIEWPDFTQMEFDRPVIEIDEASIEAELEEQRLNMGEAAPTTEPMTRGDEAVGGIQLTIVQTGTLILALEEITIRVPAPGYPAFANNVPVAGLAEALEGACAGGTIEIESIVPNTTEWSDYAGHPVVCRFDVKSTNRIQPGSIEDVVNNFGSPSEAALRQQIHLSLEARFEQEQRIHMVEVVFAQLLELIDIPVPKRAVFGYLKDIQRMHATSLAGQGIDEETIKETINSDLERHTCQADMLARRRVLTVMLGDHFKVIVGERELDEQIKFLASVQGEQVDDVRKKVVESGMIDNIGETCRQSGITGHILAVANVRDVPAAPGTGLLET